MTAPAELWRPGVDAPLFPAELLTGPGALGELDPALREQVGAYLAAVIAARGPVHVTVAWNVLHYGWDLTTRGYTETLLKVDRLPQISLDALETTPTGVIATLPHETPVWVEVVHVEADDLTVDGDGDLPAARSGAPYDRSVRMRTVVDPAIFGPPEREQRRVLERLKRRGHLDRFGHLLGRGAPTDPHRAEETAGDPILAYARWLAADPGRLGGGPVPAALETIDPELTMRAVVASMYTLLALAEADPRLTVVGEHIGLSGSVPVLATDDLNEIVRQVVRVRRLAGSTAQPTKPGTWPTARYTSAGPALRHLGPDRLVGRVRYVAALAELTAALITTAATTGDPSTLRLRLDDPGRGGGVWRAVAAAPDPGDGYDPLVPLGLGHAGSSSPLEPPLATGVATDESAGRATPIFNGAHGPGVPDPTSPPDQPHPCAPASPQETVGEQGDGLLGDLEIAASHLSFTFAMRTRHLTDGTMPVPTELCENHLGAASGLLAVRLGHDGDELDNDETFHEPVTVHTDPCQLRGLTWPLAFHPGLLLTATWTVGGRILDLTTQRLPDPATFAGITLTHAVDLTILAAHLRQAAPDPTTKRAAAGDHAPLVPEGTALDGDPADAPGHGNAEDPPEDACGHGGPVIELPYGDRDLADPGNRAYLALLLRVVIRTIKPGLDGVRSFTAPVLVATAFAGLPEPTDAVGRAHRLLDAHAARGRLLRLEGEGRFRSAAIGFTHQPPTYLWWPPGAHPPGRRPKRQLGAVVRRPQRVPVSLRQLPDGWEPSPDKVAAWPQVHASLGPTYLPERLPRGFTWVEAHERGHDPGWESGAVPGHHGPSP